MIPKEKDLHNLFTPDQKQHKDLEKCSLEDATIIMIKGKKFTLGETFEKHGVFELDSIKLRVEFDRYTDEIDVRDFDLFGIECYKPKEHKPVIFTTKVIEHSIREVDNHGMIYDALDSVCVILPDQFIECLDKEVEVTVKVK